MIVADRQNPEALQSPSVSPRHDVFFLPAQHEQSECFKKTLVERCKSQQWPAICTVQVKDLRRGVITTAKMDKGEILEDYHGKEMKGMRLNEYLAYIATKASIYSNWARNTSSTLPEKSARSIRTTGALPDYSSTNRPKMQT